MFRKITIDAYDKGNGEIELIHHGGMPRRGAIASATFKINNKKQNLKLFDAIRQSMENCNDNE